MVQGVLTDGGRGWDGTGYTGRGRDITRDVENSSGRNSGQEK